MEKGYLYILEDINQRYYIGSTDDPPRRLQQHKHGHAQTTKRMNIPSLVFIQEYETLFKSRGIEGRLKKLKRKDYITKIIKDGYIKITPK